ncbi:PEP-utilizing enzyme [Aliarcobacter cryaerophilus]|uniref:PEP/pyruvate-binding domain-containing protein n=1 Tax=Aliarcobacter cryaerophilus TaxID=28198 RepID=UPI0021B3A763|nr:PEP/pyruvate-binding domain-containing protein [Aliarcobacter cryaerophilus]MCT7523245.1 PEP-utilizing enzyme [Aliarcobacter cryaerophilus]
MNICNQIILSAGKPHIGEKPSLLNKVEGKYLFDWQINSLEDSKNLPQIVIGYEESEYKKLNHKAIFHKNIKWESTNSAYSLMCADLNYNSILVSYSDILYRPHILKDIKKSNSDVVLVCDSLYKQRFSNRNLEDLKNSEKVIFKNKRLLRASKDIDINFANAEFIGLVLFQGEALKYIQNLQKSKDSYIEKLSIIDLIEILRIEEFTIDVIDVKGDWAELNEPNDIAHFILGTKAETLFRLKNIVKKSLVLEQVSFTVKDWIENSNNILNKIKDKFKNKKIVIRSSAKSEDSFSFSNAGAYTSILNVTVDDNLVKNINEVIKSYINSSDDDQVLVQPMLENVSLNGVAFTRTLEHKSPFYIINYDESGSTENITSGNSKEHKSLFIKKNSQFKNSDKKLENLVKAIKEVEEILSYDSLDIEFAITQDNLVYLLQVRPLATPVKQDIKIKDKHILELQENASEKFLSLQNPNPNLKSKKTLFGVMPDWNPAEIIGTNPGKLAISLYNYLILEDTWAKQRTEYGYKDVRPQRLLEIFAGKPYINIRASFNSFIPNTIDEKLQEKLVDFYIDYLEKNPHLHDKVEFDVVPTCYAHKFSKWEIRLKNNANLTYAEIETLKKSLQKITNNAIFRVKDDLKNLYILKNRYINTVSSNIKNSEKIRTLLEDCKNYGTLPFAHLARSGFVAVTLLKEALEEKIISKDAYDGFFETVSTVSKEFSDDALSVKNNELTFEEFTQKYGHLRPGTYDIASKAYWDDQDKFLRPAVNQALKIDNKNSFVTFWENEKNKFFESLNNIGISANKNEIEEFLKIAIEGREKVKFEFTKNLSYALKLIESEGEIYGLSNDELSNISIYDFYKYIDSDLPKNVISDKLKAIARENQYERAVSLACCLPPLLTKAEDFEYFILAEDKANFIGNKKIISNIVEITNSSQEIKIPNNSIVLIPQADPGYDWLFGQNIEGLITMYGGANSHMAIRSAEFGLSAAIGIGQKRYDEIKLSKQVELDPSNEIIRIIY